VKYCHYCGKELTDILPFICRHCKEYYCIEHFIPEKHNCLVFNPPKWGDQPIKTVVPEEQIPQTTIEPEVTQTFENGQKYIPKTTTDTEKSDGDNKRSLKLTVSLIIIIILLTITSIGGYLILKQNYSNLIDEKRFLESELFLDKGDITNTRLQLNLSAVQLEKINVSLQDNISKINLQKTGDEYNLHDPLFSDVTQFITNDKSSNILQEIENAKEQGIHCAYIIVRMVSSYHGGQELIGFNTTDKEMVYFVPVEDYRVFPIIGYSYVDCVQGSPYYSTVDDTITDILVIW
jgi:hypothetical protein